MSENNTKKTDNKNILDNNGHSDKNWCAVCKKSLSTKWTLLDHIKMVHEKIKNVLCDQCSKAFGSVELLNCHYKRIHSDIRQFACNICGKAYMLKAELMNHTASHTGEKLQCEHCEKMFGYKKGLRSHIRNVHLKLDTNRAERRRWLKAQKGILVKPRVPVTEEERTCQQCGIVFEKRSRMKRHMTCHMKAIKENINKRVVKSNNDGKFSCKDCDKDFVSMKSVKEHIRNVHFVTDKKLKLETRLESNSKSDRSEENAKPSRNLALSKEPVSGTEHSDRQK